MDYNIKIKHEGAKPTAAKGMATRKQAIQASQSFDTKNIDKSVNLNKEINSSINKLIQSNKNLETAIKQYSSKLGAGKPPVPGTIPGAGEGAGIGGIGSSIPFLGAAIAAAGFALMKTKQIGQAYMDVTSQQIGSVGIGGFRTGQGVYLSGQMGAGMAEYARQTGRFATNVKLEKNKQLKTAEQIGGIYGLSAAEVFGQAGVFKRAGGNYAQLAGRVAGAGVESELPIVMQGMSDILQDAIRDGLDASKMAKDMGNNITKLINTTPTKSAEAAMNIIRSFQGVQKGVAQGQMGSLESVYVAQASRKKLLEDLQNPEYQYQLVKQGWISEEQSKKLSDMKGGANWNQFVKTVGAPAAELLAGHTAATANPAEMLMRTMTNIKETYGEDIKGKHAFMMTARQQKWSLTPEQINIAWEASKLKEGEGEEEGLKRLEKKYKEGVLGTEAGEGMRLKQTQELDLIKYGKSFAEATILAEDGIRTLVKTLMPSADSMKKFGNTIEGITKKFEKYSKNTTSLWDLFTE